MIRLLLLLLASLLLTACAPRNLDGLDDPAELRAELQPPLTEELATELAGQPRLSTLIEAALERNPALAASRARWLAAIHRLPQATSLEDPMIEAGYQFRDNPMGEEYSVGLSQQLPWWRKLWSRGKIAVREVDIEALRYQEVTRDLIINVKNAYYELYYLDHAIPITDHVSTALRNQGLLAYSELNSGRTQLSEAFRAESQAAQLEYDVLLLKELRTSREEELRALLNLPPDTAIGEITTAPQYPLLTNLTELQNRAEEYSQMLKIEGLEIHRARYETYLAKLNRIPDINIGLGTVAFDGMGERTNSLAGMASMNLPIWEQRNRALIDERKALEEAEKFDAMNSVNEVRKSVAAAYFKAKLTERVARLYDDTLLPQAAAVMQQTESLYRADAASFSGMLESTAAYHNFALAYHRAVADCGKAIGELERVVGTTAGERRDD